MLRQHHLWPAAEWSLPMTPRLLSLGALCGMLAACRPKTPPVALCLHGVDGGAAASMWAALARAGATCTEDAAARRARYSVAGEVLLEVTYGERTTTQVSFEQGRPVRTVEETRLDNGSVHYRITTQEGDEQGRESFTDAPGSPTTEVTNEKWDPKTGAWQLVGRKQVPSVSETASPFQPDVLLKSR